MSDGRCAINLQIRSSPRLIFSKERLFTGLPLKPEIVPVRPVALETSSFRQLRIGFHPDRQINPPAQLAPRTRDAFDNQDRCGLHGDCSVAVVFTPSVWRPPDGLPDFERLHDVLDQQWPPIEETVIPGDIVGVNAWALEGGREPRGKAGLARGAPAINGNHEWFGQCRDLCG